MKYDLAIIGGGPSAMMAAITAGRKGQKVLIIERNNSLGIKLLITGKGRCNICNYTTDNKVLIEKYGSGGKFLYSSFFGFDVHDTINFFESLGIKTKVERGDRVFPESDKSREILDALQEALDTADVEIKVNSRVKDIKYKNNSIVKIVLFDGTEISASNYLLATGGKSYPTTGSSGDGYVFLEKMGHMVNPPKPALTPIVCKNKFIKSIEGLSLKNVAIQIMKSNKQLSTEFGEALFTGNGMSGPIILNLSNYIDDQNDDYQLSIDWKPALDEQALDKRIIKDFEKYNNKEFKNSLGDLLPRKMIPIFISILKIDQNKKVNLITKDERASLLNLLKDFRLDVKGVVGYEKAIITRGGVDLKEIDPKTMKSKLIDNLYIAGEILDLDGPTGGYNLQICWSTGFAVGNSI